MKTEKIRYKHIFKRTVKHEYGTYDYFVVHINKDYKQNYLGCSRKLEKCVEILLDYAQKNNINEYQLLR
jgi:hypothetical protein